MSISRLFFTLIFSGGLALSVGCVGFAEYPIHGTGSVAGREATGVSVYQIFSKTKSQTFRRHPDGTIEYAVYDSDQTPVINAWAWAQGAKALSKGAETAADAVTEVVK